MLVPDHRVVPRPGRARAGLTPARRSAPSARRVPSGAEPLGRSANAYAGRHAGPGGPDHTGKDGPVVVSAMVTGQDSSQLAGSLSSESYEEQRTIRRSTCATGPDEVVLAETQRAQKDLADRTATVTVVIPTRDRRRLLLRTLDSVLRQDGVSVDVVVVDDGGTD